MEDLPLLIGAVVVCGVVLLGHRRWQRRRADQVQQLCLEQGWCYEASDPGLVDELELVFKLFSDGDPPRRLDHVVEARRRDLTVTFGDYSHREWTSELSSSDGEQHTRTTARHAVAVVRLPGALPALRLGKEGVLARIGGAIGFRDVEVGWAPFDRRFRVTGDDTDVASLLHPAMTELLVRQPYDRWEISGRHLLISREGRWRTEEYEQICALVEELTALVPRGLWRERTDEGRGDRAGDAW
jgi:hypothetical protein